MCNPEHLRLLEALSTDRRSHSGRTLFAHFKGTHDLLESWGNPHHVCVAGLFHSIYGTAYFRVSSAALAERRRVAGVIGESAEELAFLFCTTERDDFFNAAGQPYPTLRNRRESASVAVSPTVLSALIEIEVANMIEQTTPGAARRFTLYRLRNQLFKRSIIRQMRHMLHKGGDYLTAAGKAELEHFIESFGRGRCA